MYEIPTSIYIDNREYQIRNNGDYRMVLDCFSTLQDAELTTQERLFACLIIFYKDFNSIGDVLQQDNVQELVMRMYDFFNCGTDASMGATSNHRLIDWEQDSQLICSAINKVANKEIRAEPYVHWWTFMGYYSAIGQSPLATVIEIRDKIIKGKKLEKYELEFRRNNPNYFVWNSKTVDENEADSLLRELWNSGE